MNVLQHNPASTLHSLLHRTVSELESLRTSNSHRDQLRICFLAQLLHFKTGIESRSTRQQNRFFRLAGSNGALEIDSIVLSAFLPEHYLHKLISDRIEFVRPEYLDEDETDYLLAYWRYLRFYLGDFLLGVGAVEEVQPVVLVALDKIDEAVENGVLGQLLNLFQLLFVKQSAQEVGGQSRCQNSCRLDHGIKKCFFF